MNFNFTEDQRLIRDMVREFSEKELFDYAAEIDAEAKFPKDILKKMSQLGLLGLTVPEKYSGGEMDKSSIILAVEEIAKGCASTAIIFTVHNLVSYAIAKFGTEEQRKKYLPKMATGKIFGAMSLMEPDNIEYVVDLDLTVAKDGERYVLNGEKRLVVGGDNAGLYLVMAKDENNSPFFFLIDSGTDGMSIAEREQTVGIRGAQCVKIVFNNCNLTDKNLLGSESEQTKYLSDIFELGKTMISASAVGISERALKMVADYAFQRKQFEKFIGEFQGYRWMVAQMDCDIASAQTYLYRAAFLKDKNLPAERECAIAKILSSKTAVETTTNAIQLHGGIGYMREYPNERMFRDAKAMEFAFGKPHSQKDIIAKKML